MKRKLCEEFLQGDGINPKYDNVPKRVKNRKALQLCSQIMDILHLSLGQFGDDLLRNCYIKSVVPAPDSTQLLVTLISQDNPQEVFSHAQNASGLLRNEVANNISRKRVPQLKFQVVSS